MGRSVYSLALFALGSGGLVGCPADSEESRQDVAAVDADGTAEPDLVVLLPDSASTADDTVDAASLEDTFEPGTPCTIGNQCTSGYCVPAASGPVCAGICIESCPTGQRCVPATSDATDPVYLCVPDLLTPPGGDATSGSDSDASVGEDGTVDPDASVDGGPVDDATTDDTATATDTVDDGGGVTDIDSDGDGIPDSEDNLPCLAVYMVIYNQGVSSASVSLNGQEIVPSSSFPTSEPIVVWLNPVTGTNTLDLAGKLAGSPNDSLSISILDTDGVLYFATVILRENGAPRNYTFTFDIDVTCPPTP